MCKFQPVFLRPTLEPMLRYAITDRARFPGDESAREAALLQQAARLAAAGVGYVQLREKDLSPAALAALTSKLLATLRAHSPAPRLLINSRADVAVAAGADGVHLTSAEGSLTPARHPPALRRGRTARTGGERLLPHPERSRPRPRFRADPHPFWPGL